jgi:hypothetical protein
MITIMRASLCIIARTQEKTRNMGTANVIHLELLRKAARNQIYRKEKN